MYHDNGMLNFHDSNTVKVIVLEIQHHEVMIQSRNDGNSEQMFLIAMQ